jgi:hypothetical protein
MLEMYAEIRIKDQVSLKPESQTKDTTHHPSLARFDVALSSGFNGREMTVEIQDATEPLKRAQHQNLRFRLE